jgi:hypothetical protein
MVKKFNPSITAIAGILIAIILVASSCSQAATPLPTPLPPTLIPPTQPPDLLSLVRAYEEAVKSHDIDRIMALFTGNATYEWGQWTTAIFNQEVRDLHSYMIGVNGEWQNTGCVVDGSVVKCQAVFRDDCAKSAGIDGEHFTSIEYTFEKGKLNKVNSEELPEDRRVLWSFYTRMFDWASKNNLEGYDKLSAFTDTIGAGGGNMELTRNMETGNIMSKYCQEYLDKKP